MPESTFRVNPRSVDAWTRQEPITLPEIRHTIPLRLYKPSPVRSWLALLRVLACIVGCIWLLTHLEISFVRSLSWQVPSLAAVWLLYGWILVGLFVIGHDCGHYSFSERRWVNTLLGYLCMSPLANSFHTWRLTHNLHHRFTQLRGQEVDWSSFLLTCKEFDQKDYRPSLVTRLGYRLPFGVFLWISWNTIRRALALRSILSPSQLEREQGRLRASNWIMILTLVGIYGGLWFFFGFWAMLKYYGIPATIAMITGSLIITIQHANEDSLLYDKEGWTAVRGQLASTFDVRFPFWLEYLWCNINIHIPHHVAPSIPWYNLKEAGIVLQKAFPAAYQERRFRLRDLLWFYKAPLLKKNEDFGYYVLETQS